MEKSRDLGKEVQDSGRVAYPITRNKGKEPIILDDVDTSTDDELSSSSSPSLSLSLKKNAQENAKVKSCKRPSHHLAFRDVVNGTSRRVRRETSKRQNQPIQAPRNVSVLLEGAMPPVLPVGTMSPMSIVHPAFGTEPTFYMPSTALIRRSDDMLSLPLGQHILDYELPHGFVIPAFSMFDGFFTLTIICSIIIRR